MNTSRQESDHIGLSIVFQIFAAYSLVIAGVNLLKARDKDDCALDLHIYSFSVNVCFMVIFGSLSILALKIKPSDSEETIKKKFGYCGFIIFLFVIICFFTAVLGQKEFIRIYKEHAEEKTNKCVLSTFEILHIILYFGTVDLLLFLFVIFMISSSVTWCINRRIMAQQKKHRPLANEREEVDVVSDRPRTD